MKRYTFITLILLASCSRKSSNLIVGKWQFVDFYNYQNPDTTLQNDARAFWTHYKMSFNSNKKHHSEGIFPDSGRWHLDEKHNTIKLGFIEGAEEILNVVELNKKKLVVTFLDSVGIILQKVSSN